MANVDPGEGLLELLGTLSRKQLAELLLSAARSDRSTHSNIHRAVDADPSHRDLFVNGFGVDLGVPAAEDSLRRCFSPFGEIESVSIPVGDNGRHKGHGFVLFRHLASAKKALRQPRKPIDSGRTTTIFCSHTRSARRIRVRNLPLGFKGLPRLLEFFKKFGEIEEAKPIFDHGTSVCLVYKTLEGAVRAFEQPRKYFEGFGLICEKEEYGSRALPRMSLAPNAGVVGAYPTSAYYVPGMGGGYGGFNYPNAGAIGAHPTSVYYAPGMGGVYLGPTAGDYQGGPTGGGGFRQH